MNFCIFGAGAWGTAMALHLAREDHEVTLVPRRLEHAQELSSKGENTAYLPGFRLGKGIRITWKIRQPLADAEVVLLACPSKGLRSLCGRLAQEVGKAGGIRAVLGLCKGLETGSNLLPAEVISEALPDLSVGSLSGPTFACEVAAGKPAAIVFGTGDESDSVLEIQHAISSESLRVYRSYDLPGVELGACLKNVYAIAAGMCDGLRLGDNAKAALLTRSLAEMVRLGTSLGGKVETFYGLSGFGDLVATCSGERSRNRQFGQLIAEGHSIGSLVEERRMTVEGFRTSDCFYRICRDHRIEAPILAEIKAVLYDKKAPHLVINSLMSRDLKVEQ